MDLYYHTALIHQAHATHSANTGFIKKILLYRSAKLGLAE
jgi:hypothetical protein